jgi:hypothetical protein
VPIKPGILFQPHPAFAKDAQGQYRYHAMQPGDAGRAPHAAGLRAQGTRELVAEDFVYALKRHATTRITTPIFGLLPSTWSASRTTALIKKEDAASCARGSTRQPGQALPGLPPLAAGRCQRTGEAPAAHPHQGQVPAVEVLDADDLPGADALGGRRLLCPARAWPSGA